MKTLKITRYKCDKCEKYEDVEEGNESQVKWREVQLDWSNDKASKEFQFCAKCVGETFGKQYAADIHIATNARHLRTDQEIFADVEEQTNRVRDGSPANMTFKSMELLNGKAAE